MKIKKPSSGLEEQHKIYWDGNDYKQIISKQRSVMRGMQKLYECMGGRDRYLADCGKVFSSSTFAIYFLKKLDYFCVDFSRG